jgi:hypothetical protein
VTEWEKNIRIGHRGPPSTGMNRNGDSIRRALARSVMVDLLSQLERIEEKKAREIELRLMGWLEVKE